MSGFVLQDRAKIKPLSHETAVGDRFLYGAPPGRISVLDRSPPGSLFHAFSVLSCTDPLTRTDIGVRTTCPKQLRMM